MNGFFDLTAPEAGQWFRLPVPELEPDERPELLIRALGTSERQEIFYTVWGRRRVIRVKPGKTVITAEDNARDWRRLIASAAAALVDCRRLGFAFPEEHAAKLSGLLGETVPVGEFFVVDGKLKKLEVRQMLVGLLAEVRPSVVRWIEEKSLKLASLDADEEDDLAKT